jgi:hypothetical protein
LDSWFKSYGVFEILAEVQACCQPLPMQENLPKLPKSAQRQLIQETLKYQKKFKFFFLKKKKKKTSMCILFGFSIQEFSICPFQFQKMAVVCEF